jgi:hypothetical protein
MRIFGLIRHKRDQWIQPEDSFAEARQQGDGSACNESEDVMVQHFSLPWGSSCQGDPNPPVVDAVVPSQCARKQKYNSEIDQCNEITKDIWGFAGHGAAVKYPPRYQLDIVSHKEWYDAHCVEQFFIIVVRDKTISSAARHCNKKRLKDEEEKVGTDIIVNAILIFWQAGKRM